MLTIFRTLKCFDQSNHGNQFEKEEKLQLE